MFMFSEQMLAFALWLQSQTGVRYYSNTIWFYDHVVGEGPVVYFPRTALQEEGEVVWSANLLHEIGHHLIDHWGLLPKGNTHTEWWMVAEEVLAWLIAEYLWLIIFRTQPPIDFYRQRRLALTSYLVSSDIGVYHAFAWVLI